MMQNQIRMATKNNTGKKDYLFSLFSQLLIMSFGMILNSLVGLIDCFICDEEFFQIYCLKMRTLQFFNVLLIFFLLITRKSSKFGTCQ